MAKEKLMTDREKKIFKKKLKNMSINDLSEIWKITFRKKLSNKEMQKFDLLRTVYKEKSGKILPQHSSKSK